MGLMAYNCKVPLHATPWAYHKYTCIDINGTMICRGQDRSGSALGSPSKESIDKYVPGKCRRRSSNSCFEQYILDEWKKPRPWYGIPFGTDCQEYDDYINNRCWEKCKNAK